jgi:hypothetical protein
MEFPKDLKIKIKNTSVDIPRGTALLTGMPRVGKTRLAAELAVEMCGAENVFIIDFPEEEGTSTCADMGLSYVTVLNQADVNEAYRALLFAKPKAVIWDGLGSSYWMLMKERVPGGIPPEDHGKTWMTIANQLRNELTRFKTMVSVEWFFATSLVWPDKDEITGKEGRLQVVLPGQLKSNIYGLFSYNMNILMEAQPNGTAIRALELQPTVRTVAGVRAPWSWKIPPKVVYDLAGPEGVKKIVSTLRVGKPSV